MAPVGTSPTRNRLLCPSTPSPSPHSCRVRRYSLHTRCLVTLSHQQGVQIAANWICQRDFLPLLEKYYPGHTFETRHVDAATVLQLAEHGDLVEPHEQPERERHQINRVSVRCWGGETGMKATRLSRMSSGSGNATRSTGCAVLGWGDRDEGYSVEPHEQRERERH
eukprot:363950-Chlamydomonas_euryale.AAC.4